jgi:hypothetical protein
LTRKNNFVENGPSKKKTVETSRSIDLSLLSFESSLRSRFSAVSALCGSTTGSASKYYLRR